MADILQNVPQGFHEAIEECGLLPREMLAQICEDVSTFLQYRSGPVNTDKYIQLLKSSAALTREVSLTSIVNALTHLFRSAGRLKLESSELRSQLSYSSVFTPQVIEILVRLWELQGKQLVAASAQFQSLNIGQLLDVQWKVGVAVSSDDCKNLNSPTITLLFTVSETGGNTSKHTVEMTLSQFRNFSSRLRDMAALMETV